MICMAMSGNIASTLRTRPMPTLPRTEAPICRGGRGAIESRGGSWSHNPAICRSAYRDVIAPDNAGWQGRIGLRVACTL